MFNKLLGASYNYTKTYSNLPSNTIATTGPLKMYCTKPL